MVLLSRHGSWHGIGVTVVCLLACDSAIASQSKEQLGDRPTGWYVTTTLRYTTDMRRRRRLECLSIRKG
jgi:hypothetical protein